MDCEMYICYDCNENTTYCWVNGNTTDGDSFSFDCDTAFHCLDHPDDDLCDQSGDYNDTDGNCTSECTEGNDCTYMGDMLDSCTYT